MVYDLLVKNGLICDGSGSPSYAGDVGIKDGRIAAIGQLDGEADRVIDAAGLVVAPGFIDVHTHYDAQVFWDPVLTSSCWHGVTTVVTGNCGLTFAPVKADDRDWLIGMFARVEGMSRNLLAGQLPWNWETFPEYISAVSDQKLGLNVAPLVGHSALRIYAMGADAVTRTEATPEELEQMKGLLRDGMNAGAWGFSFSRIAAQVGENGEPMPGMVASEKELIELSNVVGEFGRGFIESVPRITTYQHVSERDADFEMLKTISRESGRPTTWISLTQQYNMPNLWKEMLQKTQDATAEGYITYPQVAVQPTTFTFSLRNVSIIVDDLPHWRKINYLPVDERQKALRDPEIRKGLRYDMTEDNQPRVYSKKWHLTTVHKTALEKNRHFEGRTLEEIAQTEGRDPFDVFIDLSLEEDLDTEFLTVLANGEEDIMEQIVRECPNALISLSDGGAHVQFLSDVGYPTYLLSHWVREKQYMSLETAVRKLSGYPAEILGFKDRGLLKTDMMADLAIFDPKTVARLNAYPVNDLPNGEPRLVRMAEGIRYTVINGEVVVEDGKLTGARPGRILSS